MHPARAVSWLYEAAGERRRLQPLPAPPSLAAAAAADGSFEQLEQLGLETGKILQQASVPGFRL